MRHVLQLVLLFGLAVAPTVVSAAGQAGSVRDLGVFGQICTPAMRIPMPPELRTAATEAWPRPAGIRLTAVVDLACPSTLQALEALRELRRTHPAVEIELLVVDPSAFGRIPDDRAAAVLTSSAGIPFRWNPVRLHQMELRAVPFFRLEDPSGRVVTATGTPNLDALLGGLR